MNQTTWHRAHDIGRVKHFGSYKNKPKCKHCSKWLRKEEIKKYACYCFKCGEHMPQSVIDESFKPRILQALDKIIGKQERLKQLRSIPYAEYLKTPEWRHRRGRAIKQAHKQCAVCLSGKELNVHHRNYERIGCEKDNDLVVLCRECHSKFHDKFNRE